MDVKEEASALVEEAVAEFEKVKAMAEQDAAEVKAEVEKYYEELKGKSMWELMKLHDAAVVAEDAAKRELVVLRQRAANMASTVNDEVDKEISAAKQKVAEAIAWLHAIEAKLEGVPRDIWGAKYGRNH